MQRLTSINQRFPRRICEEYDGKNIRQIARNYGYSESRVRQIIRKNCESM